MTIYPAKFSITWNHMESLMLQGDQKCVFLTLETIFLNVCIMHSMYFKEVIKAKKLIRNYS